MARTEIDYEYDDVTAVEAKNARARVKTKGGAFGKIVALFLGLVIGVAAGAGGVVGAGYYVATQMQIKDVASTVTNLSGFEIPLSDYLSGSSSEKTLVGLIENIADTATSVKDGKGTLGDLNAISPFVKTLLEKEGSVLDLLKGYGIETTAEELMSKIVVKNVETEDYDDRYLGDFLLLKINEIPFAKLVNSAGFEGSKMITTLCYGIEGINYEIVDGEYVMLGNSEALTVGGFMSKELDRRIERLPLDAVMGTPQDEIMRTLFYGAEHRYTVMDDGSIEMNRVFYTYDGSNFYDDSGEQLPLLNYTGNPDGTYLLTFKDESQQIVMPSLDGKYYASTADEDKQIIRYKKTTIGDLKDEANDLINSITLESALNVNKDSHAILKSIIYDKNGRKRTIKDLREKGNELINDVALSSIIPADADDSIIMYLLFGRENVHYSIAPVTHQIFHLQKRVAVYNGKVYNEYGELIKNATAYGTTSYRYGSRVYDLTADASLGTVQIEVQNGSTTTKHDAPLFYVSYQGEKIYYEPTTIGDMQNAEVLSKLTGRLRLKDVMDVSGHKILNIWANKRLTRSPMRSTRFLLTTYSANISFIERITPPRANT